MEEADMSKGINKCFLAGNLAGKITYGETRRGDKAISFWIVSDDRDDSVWIKVNAFGVLAEICERRLKKGMYVIVSGALMNRRTEGDRRIIEVKAQEVVFPKEGEVKNDGEKEGVSGIGDGRGEDHNSSSGDQK